MGIAASDALMCEALDEWARAWEEGEDPSADELRPAWQPDRRQELADRIANRKAVVDRCLDLNTVSQTTPWGGEQPDAQLPEIPNYNVVRVLGRGGQGVAYEAEEQSVLQRHVVIKVMTSASSIDSQRFIREARALADLDHPNIVKIHHADYWQSQPYLVLEYCSGGTLHDKLKDGGTLAPLDAVRLVALLADAIDAAHQQGIVHRDLKPGNILLTGGGVPKLTDFGFSKREEDLSLTQAGCSFGTPGYWAPEQISGAPHATGVHTDIYGLGAILYRLLTGLPPVPPNLRGKAAMDAQESIRPPTKVGRGIPRDLDSVCMKCLEKLSQDRYRSARELAHDLHRVLRNEPVEARPVGTHKRVFRTLTRSRLDSSFREWRSLALVTAVFLSLQATWSLVFYQSGHPGIAFDWLGGSGIFWVGMASLLAMCMRRNFERGRQFSLCIGLNLVGCALMQFLEFGPFFSLYDSQANVWAPSAAINAISVGFTGLFLDWRFLFGVGLVYFAAWSVILSKLPFQWACFWYGQAWALFLVALSVYLRMLKPENASSDSVP